MRRNILFCLLLLFVGQAAGQARTVQPLASQPLNFDYRYRNETGHYTYVYPNGGPGSYERSQVNENNMNWSGANSTPAPYNQNYQRDVFLYSPQIPRALPPAQPARVIIYNNATFTLCKHSGGGTTCRQHKPGDPADRPGHPDYYE